MSADTVIRAENLSKRYVLSHLPREGTLAATLQQTARGVWHRLRARRAATSEEFWALRDVSFEIKRGEVVGVIGRNGAGKSTLLKVLSRITEPTTGRITLKGRVASLLEVGTGFHPELTGRDNVFLNGAILGMTRAEIRRKFDEIVAFAEVERFLDTPVKRYSSGMYVRLAFSVAAHLEPEILIVDEVLAVGDQQFQNKCLGKMQDVTRQEGRTVLLVSHNLQSIRQLSTQVIHLSGGRLIGSGDPAKQIHLYAANLARRDGAVPLADRPRALQLLNRTRLLSAELLGVEPGANWTVPFDTPLRVRFTVRVEAPFTTLELGLGLFNQQSVEIVSTLSNWHEKLGPFEPGVHHIDVDYGDLELAPGLYRLGAGLRSPAGLEDYVPEAFEFEIVAPLHQIRSELGNIRGAIARTARFSHSRAT